MSTLGTGQSSLLDRDFAGQSSRPVPEVTKEQVARIAAAWPHDWSLTDNLLVLVNVGSISHGTQLPKSTYGDFSDTPVDDVDFLGVVVPPKEVTLGLRDFEHWVWMKDELDVVIYSIQKFTRLLLKGNPNVVGLLFHPADSVVITSDCWPDWIAERNIFMSQRVLSSFSGYAYSQLTRLGHPSTRGYMGAERKELFLNYGYDLKNAAHCLRLLRMGIEVAETGVLNVNRTGIDAEDLMEIKRGKWTLGQVQREAEREFKHFEALVKESTLPVAPNENAAQELLIATIMEYWGLYGGK